MSTLKKNLETIFGHNEFNEFFEECDNIDDEFVIIKKFFYKAVRIAHPDKGGTAEAFRELHGAFEVVRDMYEKKSVASFATTAGGPSVSTSEYYEQTMHAYDTSDMPMPSWEFYEAAEEEPVPTYRVESAKSDRSQCVQKGTACKHGEPKPSAASFIAKGTTRIGSFDKESGSYIRWVHLICFRVPAKVWKGLPDPETCSDEAQFAAALRQMNEVLLSGFHELSEEAQQEFVQFVMNKENWAKDRRPNRTAQERLQEAEEARQALRDKLAGIDDDEERERVRAKLHKAEAEVEKMAAKRQVEEEKKANAAQQVSTDIPVFSEGFGAAAKAAREARENGTTTMTAPVQKQRFIVPVPGRDGVAHVLKGKTVVMTGVFPEVGGGAGLNLGKDRVKAMIESFGGKVTSSISGKTDILIVGKSPGLSKVTQARSRDKVQMFSLQEIASGICAGLIEAPAEPMKIASFSKGFTFRNGESNGLAVNASPAALLEAGGFAPMAIDSEAKESCSSSSSSSKPAAVKMGRAVKAPKEVKPKVEKVVTVTVKTEQVVAVKVKAEKLVKTKTRAPTKKEKEKEKEKAVVQLEAVSSSLSEVTIGSGSGRSTRQSSRRAAAAHTTPMITN